MDIGRGNDCVVYIRNNTHTQYLINGACVLVNMDPKIAAMTNVVSGRGGGPIPLVSGSAMGIKGKRTVYTTGKGRVRGVIPMPISQSQLYESDNGICCYR